MNAQILERVRSIAADIFGVPVSQLTTDSSPETVEAWDSVQHLSFVLELEQAFGVHVEPEDMDKMKTLGAVAALIDAKARADAAGQ